MNEKYDLVVIGAGPGGYTAAIKAAKLGLKTAIIEDREVGGTCLNRGCIPTKTLMFASHLYYEASSFEKLGINVTGLSYDMEKIQDRKETVVDKIRDGIGSLLKGNKITVLNGTATILNQNTIRITGNAPQVSEEETAVWEIPAEKILIATGSKPFIPEIEGIHNKNVITSDELLTKREQIYKKLLIIGGGVIGIEFATIYQELGCEVEIIEVMDRILYGMDKEVSQSVAMNLKKRGIKIHTKSKVLRIIEEGLGCEYEEAGKVKMANADAILISAGRKANTEKLFDSGFQIDRNGEKIKIDTNFETSVKGIYAIGDVTGGTQLAHAAAAQGIAAVEVMCNLTPTINLNVIPACIYTSPEVAVVGFSEEAAIKNGYMVKTGKYPMSGNAKTLLSLDERSYIKVISDSESDKILGAQIVCARATDMIGEFATAIVNGLTVKEMASVIRPHPTYNEAITEAIEDIEGMAIHLMPDRK